MRVVIELDDATLRHAVETQVDKTISELAAGRVAAKVDEILDKKFDRLTDGRIDEIAGIAAAKFLRGDSNRYEIEAKINKALSAAARELVRDHSRTL